jgi:hypothetical protein
MPAQPACELLTQRNQELLDWEVTAAVGLRATKRQPSLRRALINERPRICLSRHT